MSLWPHSVLKSSMGPLKNRSANKSKHIYILSSIYPKQQVMVSARVLPTPVSPAKCCGWDVSAFFAVSWKRCAMPRRSISTFTTPWTCWQRVTNSRTSVYWQKRFMRWRVKSIRRRHWNNKLTHVRHVLGLVRRGRQLVLPSLRSRPTKYHVDTNETAQIYYSLLNLHPSQYSRIAPSIWSQFGAKVLSRLSIGHFTLSNKKISLTIDDLQKTKPYICYFPLCIVPVSSAAGKEGSSKH